ncbi:MAG: gamma-glutamyl-phosphate reductase [Firmicutes bacterium ML8_F2]|nr:MAG: gamma-glutamyl-phosphate reductase [Firmicutes bacterium ML8_F2]
MKKMHPEVLEKCQKARSASAGLAYVSTSLKNEFLLGLADMLRDNSPAIIEANKIDLENLQKKKGYSKAFHDRLLLNEGRIDQMAEGLREIASLEDPIGEVVEMWKRPNGLQIGQVRVPMGVVAIIYEARPNVTIDAAGLALKAGNAVVLRGSSEAINSNKAIVSVIKSCVEKYKLPDGSINLIEETDRAAAADLMRANQYLDLLIPRGGKSLIRAVVENATVPVIETGVGNCHVYIDQGADPSMAVDIAVNAKIHRPGVCNAAETILVHRDTAPLIMENLIEKLLNANVEIRGCPKTQSFSSEVKEADESDWETEYLDLIIAVKVVESFEEAINHINRYGTGHSEAIVTSDYKRSREFLNRIDAAAVYVNASTRFTDGSEFGLGAEMGISTQKLHVRGPMGLQALTSIKYIIYGEGQIRQ